MGNFALQTSPCSFLKLHISPWKIPSILLLSSSLSWSLPSFSFPHRQQFYQILLSPPSLSSKRSRRRRPGALLPRAGGARQACTGAGERLCAGVDKRAGAARELAAGGARAAQPAQERRPSRRGSARPQVWGAAAAWRHG
jgi:hypothetical protein